MPPQRGAGGRFVKGGGGSVATASVDIVVPLSKLARALGQARALSHRVVSSMGRHIMATMTRAWTMAAASVKLFSRAMMSVGRTIKSVLGPMMLLLAPLVGVAGLIGTLTAFGKFEAQMSKVKGVTRATAEDFKKLWDLAKDLGATTAFSASQAAESMSNFAIAGFSVKEIMDSMKPTLDLAAAGALDMATASDIVIGMLKGMGLETSELSTAVDTMVNAFTGANIDLVLLGESFKTMGPVGKAAGKGIQELAAAIMALGDAGLKGADSGTAMRNLLLRLQAQPSEVAKALKELGMVIDDGSGSMKHMSVIIDELNEKMSGYTMMQKSALIMQLAGTRAAAAMNILLARGGDELRRLEELLGAEGSAARLAATMLDNLKGSWTLLMSALEGAAIALGEAIAPAFRKIVESLQPLTGVLGQVLEKLKPVVDWWGGRMVAGIKASTTWLSAHLDMFERWGKLAAEIIDNVTTAWSRMIEWISTKLHLSVSGFVDVLDKAIEAMATLTSNPAEGFIAIGEVIKAGFFYGAEWVVKGLRVAFSAFVATFASAGIFIATYWRDILRISWDALKGIFTWFWETGRRWGLWLVEQLSFAIKKLFYQVREADILAKAARQAALDKVIKGEPEGFGDLAGRYAAAWKDVYDGVNKAVADGLTGGLESFLRGKGDAAMKRAGEAWGAASSATAERRRLAGAGGVFGMGGVAAGAGDMSSWAQPWTPPEGKPKLRLPTEQEERRAAYEGAKAERRDSWLAGKAARQATFLGVPPEETGKVKGKGGEVRMMGLQEYLAQLQADLTKKDKEDLIAKGVTSTATNTSDDGPIVKELVAIKNKKGVAGFA